MEECVFLLTVEIGYVLDADMLVRVPYLDEKAVLPVPGDEIRPQLAHHAVHLLACETLVFDKNISCHKYVE